MTPEPLKHYDYAFVNIEQVVKRVMQLTGKWISDSRLNKCKNGVDIIGVLVENPKPKKLFEILETKEDLVGLPNVDISARRPTRLDKEMDIGRRKVVERALRIHGLAA
jgi:hypothetical protein